MAVGSETAFSFVGAVLAFFSQEAVLGLITGVLLGGGIQIAWSWWQRRQHAQQLLQLLEETAHLNKAIVEKNLALMGKDLEQLPALPALEPLYSFYPTGADLLWQSPILHHPHGYLLWQSLKKIDLLNQQVTAFSQEIFELKRTIKGETRTEVLRVELIPYLKNFNTLTMMRLTELGLECKKATDLLVELGQKKRKPKSV